MRMMILIIICFYCFNLGYTGLSIAQSEEVNYDESKVPVYKLPDPLMLENGESVTNSKTWIEKRRGEILKLFETNVYGKAPNRPKKVAFKMLSLEKDALNGMAIRKQIALNLTGKTDGPILNILIYLPKNQPGPHPLFIGLNFYGNHTIHGDKGIYLSKSWLRNNKDFGITENKASERSRGVRSSRWAVERILERGYGLATAYYGDIDPDFHDDFKNGVHPFFYSQNQNKPADDEWGAISAWAWGLSRAMDYLEQDNDVRNDQVILMGHSRLGKTALWCGAQDQRFAIVISNNSGCGGAALSRRRFGETVKRINKNFPHWFCANFKKFDDKEHELPVDQHMLIALIAPRPVYVASAEEDRWADPRGEFLSAKNADPVYRLFGTNGIGVSEMPPINQPVMTTIGYHIRTGRHNVTAYDWERYIDFADVHIKGKK